MKTRIRRIFIPFAAVAAAGLSGMAIILTSYIKPCKRNKDRGVLLKMGTTMQYCDAVFY
jgi:hypothetical protein